MHFLEIILEMLGGLGSCPAPENRKDLRVFAGIAVPILVVFLTVRYLPDGIFKWALLGLEAFVGLLALVIASHKP